MATKRYKVFSVGLGIVFMLMYFGYAIAFYYGANLVSIGEATPGTVFTVVNYNIIMDYYKTYNGLIRYNNALLYFLGFL